MFLLRALRCMAVASACAGAPAPAAAAESPRVQYQGLQRLHYEVGPITVRAGRNLIDFEATRFKPPVDGYITRFQPNLRRADGSIPAVDVLHLHHAVWLMRGQPAFAAGEEKTIYQFPRGFGYRYDADDPWILNHMLHNLQAGTERVYITYDIDFVPADAPGAEEIREVKPLWMDVAGMSTYPVFDARRGQGGPDGRYTFPDEARGRARADIGAAHRFTAPRDMTLVSAAGHLHPGGLWTDLEQRRGGERRQIFRSEAKYFEPAGAVSWDVAMTVTDPDWRVRVRQGDELRLSATYDTRRASWYESMGIDTLFYAEGDAGGKDPFAEPVDTRGEVTHGHLKENDNHGGARAGLPDPRRMPSGPPRSTIAIEDFTYGTTRRPPTVRQGRSLRFRNDDSRDAVWHTVTACRAPCNRTAGIAYPLADGPVDFDSGELGIDSRFATAAAGRTTWSTPKSLRPGTYTYFCRIHPFMRGAFRVKPRRSAGRGRGGAPRAGRR